MELNSCGMLDCCFLSLRKTSRLGEEAPAIDNDPGKTLTQKVKPIDTLRCVF